MIYLKDGWLPFVLKKTTTNFMKRLDEFRIYYNHSIHPELIRMERNRIRLLRLLFFSAILLAGIFILQLYLNVLVLALFLMIPMGFYIGYLVYRIRRFTQVFKPRIMNLILDFIDDGLNYGTLTYNSKGLISKERFLASQIFASSIIEYHGEDHISGKIGEMDFELCELIAKEFSPVENSLRNIFQGVFLYAIFNEETEGSIVVWPREARHSLSRSIKAFTWDGGKNVDHEIMNERFREIFMVYATEDTHVIGILSEPMQDAIVNYVDQSGKELYISFIDKEIYAAISEPKDILEPYVFRSNLSFDLVKEFFEDIHLALSIIEDFDQTH